MKKIFFQLIVVIAITFSVNIISANAALTNGIVNENGKSYYYENGVKSGGFKTIDGETYFFSRSPNMYGEMRTGLLLIDNQYYGFQTDGKLQKNSLGNYEGKTYYFENDGIAVGGFKTINGETYFFSRSPNMYGVMRTGLIMIDELYYGFQTDGKLQKNSLGNYNGKTYYFGNDGTAQGGFNNVDGKTYFFSRAKEMYGEMRTGLLEVENNHYLMDSNGLLQYGLIKYNDNIYYSDPKGIIQTGFQVTEGKTYFFSRAREMYGMARTGSVNIDGTYYFFSRAREMYGEMRTGLLEINERKYYYNEKGIMQLGFQKIDNNTYFFSRDINNWGANRVGFIEVDGNTYYFDENGIMVTGYYIINGKCYYFNDSGVMDKSLSVMGFIEIDNKKYFIQKDGLTALGFQEIMGNTYFFSRSPNMYGVMRTDFVSVDGKTYFFNQDGKLQYGKFLYNGNTYYSDTKGVLQTGFQVINGQTYFFSNANSMYGAMRTGFATINGNLYFFSRDTTRLGTMKIGWADIDGYQYYFNTLGIAARDWTTIDGVKCFFNSLGHLLGKNVKKVIDVSAWQGVIDWDQVKNNGDVDGVILRVAAGSNQEDSQIGRNISELNRLNIPYGLYIYSYAENEHEGFLEAERVINTIKKYNAKLTYPIYMDLEANEYTNTYNSSNYLPIVRAFMNRLKQDGYTGKIYTYTNWANNALNDPELWNQIDWIAHYAHECGYTGNYNGWQYSSTEKVPGINTNVDMNVWFR